MITYNFQLKYSYHFCKKKYIYPIEGSQNYWTNKMYVKELIQRITFFFIEDG